MTKTQQAVNWMMESLGRSQADAARKFGVAPSNLSVALRLAKQNRGTPCPLCGCRSIRPASSQPAQVAPVPGFVPVRPAQTEEQIAADINAYYAEHGAELCKPEPMSEVQRFIMERDARLGMQDPAVTPRVPDELRGVIKDD